MKSIRDIRLFGIALIDLVSTIIVSVLLAHYTKKSFIFIFSILFLSGIILHRIFKVNSTINKLIFGKV